MTSSVDISDLTEKLHIDWEDIIDYDDIMKVLGNKEIDMTNICPKRELMLKSFEFFEPYATEVIIVGQDPYPQIENAMGLSFSVPNVRRIPGSLVNIYLALANLGYFDRVDFSEKTVYDDVVKAYGKNDITGNLSGWAMQGVLLINMALTCEQNQSASHSGLWTKWSKKFHTKLSNFLARRGKSITYLLWGRDAQSLEGSIKKGFEKCTVKHEIMKYGHPSNMRIAKDSTEHFKFCDHFKMINDKTSIRLCQTKTWLSRNP